MRDAIVVQGLGKRFYRPQADRPVTLKETLLHSWHRTKSAKDFWALQNVSFSIAPGRMVGVLGSNGAGKSTLLRLLGGVGRPDKGSVRVNGRIGALLDLGVGFHPDLTGRENVFISGIVAGLTRQEVTQRFKSIVNFAELQQFIDSPLRTYSTGMQMRLAFAVAIHTAPDILLIDEVLAVGDIAFQRKCIEQIMDFKAKGCTIILVSHSPTQVQQLCDEVLWLRAGQLIAHGDPEVVTGQYIAEMTAETRKRTPVVRPDLRTPTGTILQINKNRFGSLELEILAARLLDPEGFAVAELNSGDSLRVEIEYWAAETIDAPIFGVTITDKNGQVCYDTSTVAAELSLPPVQGRGRIALQFERLDLSGGQYYVNVGVYERNWAYAYDYHWHVYPLLIRSIAGEKGFLRPPCYWEVSETQVLSLEGCHTR
jgi:lipopolysaccharide transport system ATP-binding protein